MNICRKKGDIAGKESEYKHVTNMKTCKVSLSLMKESKVNRTLTGNVTAEDINPNATRDVFLGDAWFSSVELVVQAMKIHDSYYIGVVKTNSSKYPKKFIEETMQNWPAGSHINLETVVDEVPIIATGYKYCKRKILFFVWTKGAGHTEPGDPYIAKWHDSKSNRCERWIDRPAVISMYFAKCNGIDVANMMRQKILRLEKSWKTHDGYFRLLTSLIGINVVDAWQAYRHHCRCNHSHKNIELQDFAKMLSYDMLFNQLSDQEALKDSFTISTGREQPPQTHHNHTPPQLMLPDQCAIVNDIMDNYRSHNLVQITKRERNGSGWRLKRARCTTKGCPGKTSMYCPACFPPDNRDKAWICSKCEQKHQLAVRSKIAQNAVITVN